MHGTRTWRQRIIDVLDLSDKHKPSTSASFIDFLLAHEKTPDSLRFAKWDKRKKEFVPTPSRSIISKTIALCSAFGLLDSQSANLTSLGVRATNPVRFDGITSEQAWKVLTQEFGLPRQKFSTIAKRLLHENQPVLPTADVLWEQLGSPNDLKRFKRLLRLLWQCGGVEATQRTVFLPTKSS